MTESTRPRGALAALSLLLTLATAALILVRPAVWGGIACAAATICLASQGGLRWTARGRFLDAASGFVFDAAVLGAVSWVLRGTPEGAAALIALSTSLLADYLVARATSLGYLMDDGIATRFIRGALISLALLTGGAGWLWALAVVATLTAIVRGLQVPKRELAGG